MMPNSDNTLVITNGNDPQIPFVCRMHDQLHDRNRGDFSGDFLFVSDRLDRNSRRILEERSIPYHILDQKERAFIEGNYVSDWHPLGKLAKPAFALAGLKRSGSDKKFILYLDPDIVVQSPIDSILQLIPEGKVFVTAQSKPMLDTPWCVSQLMRAVNKGVLSQSEFRSSNLEVNTGIFAGQKEIVERFLETWNDFALSKTMAGFSNCDAGQKNAWHDQDFFRCLFRKRPDLGIAISQSNQVVHLCSDGHLEVKYNPNKDLFLSKRPKTKPCLVHLAGKTHRRYYELHKRYNLERFRIDHWITLHSKANILIWGTGTGGQNASNFIPKKANIIGYIDNDPTKWGQLFRSKLIRNPNTISTADFDFILIASAAPLAISEQLELLGIPKNKVLSIHEPFLSKYEKNFKLLRKQRGLYCASFAAGLAIGAISASFF